MASAFRSTLYRVLAMTILTLALLSYSTATKAGIQCHDCTGLEQCNFLLQNQWTGKCRAQVNGKCFIRRDPNGILYRGCADTVNWPELDISYNGCRYQSYGSWGKTPVIWCFCNFELCNFNITYVTLTFPSASDSGIITEVNQGQGKVGQGQGGSWSQQPGSWGILTKEKLHGGSKGKGQDSSADNQLPIGKQPPPVPPVIGEGHGKTSGKESSGWHWGIENVPSNSNGVGVLPFPPNVYPPEHFPAEFLPPNKRPPSWRPGGKSIDDWKIVEKYWRWIQNGGIKRPTKIPATPPPTTPSHGGHPTLLPPYTIPANTATNRGPLYNIPDELLRYLLENLPKDSNDIRSIPYPVYVILYLLVSSGVDISTIPGLNITSAGNGLPPDWNWNLWPHKGNYPMFPGCQSIKCSHYCEFVDQQPSCRCRPGFSLDNDQRSCNDVDECKDGRNGGCSQRCMNTVGSFYCECHHRYELLTDQHTCRDIDECSYRNGGCSDVCQNLPGSYSCSCRPGFNLGIDNRTCYSQNDCRNFVNGIKCQQMCVNATCSCFQGYQLATDGFTCLDVDECAEQIDGCPQICTNSPGSYWCSCAIGYRLASNMQDCSDEDECLQNNGGCSQLCTNIPGSYKCDCSAGYTLDKDQKTCQGSCPVDFIRDVGLRSCYKVVTPVQSQASEALSVGRAMDQCRQLHPLATLVSLETVAEKEFLSKQLVKESAMLEGWQGWWTSGRFRTGINQFYWASGGNIPNTSEFWGFQRPPLQDTCAWILQIPNYNYTLGNYDCNTPSGYICEISFARLENAQ